MTNNFPDSQYDISVKNFTGSFILTDKAYTRCKYQVHDIAFKIKTKLNFLRFDEGMYKIYVSGRVYLFVKFDTL